MLPGPGGSKGQVAVAQRPARQVPGEERGAVEGVGVAVWGARRPLGSASSRTATPWSRVEGVERGLAHPAQLQTARFLGSRPRVAFGLAG